MQSQGEKWYNESREYSTQIAVEMPEWDELSSEEKQRWQEYAHDILVQDGALPHE